MRRFWSLLLLGAFFAAGVPLFAQSINAGTVTGVVVDATGALVPHASVALSDPATGFRRAAGTDAQGGFRFYNVPFGAYRLDVQAAHFAPARQAVAVVSPVPMQVTMTLKVAASSTTVQVEATGATVVNNTPAAHTGVNRIMLAELPDTSPGAALEDAITLSSPSVAADSNGFFHPLGDHSQTSFVLDGQPISDQQSKLFSTSIPANALESMDLITAAPSAEYGDKTSLVVQATTRSGLGLSHPTGSLEGVYGSFGTVGEEASLGLGGAKFGNFAVVDATRSGRFLDSPEFQPLHDAGNNGTVFDRVDWQPNADDAFHMDLFAARNQFQIPNTYDQQAAGQGQRQRVVSFNIAPGYQRILNAHALLTLDTWLRHDQVNYNPSANPFADRPATLGQTRLLANYGGKVNWAYNRNGNNLMVGGQVMQTRLNEAFQLGLTDPLFNAVCVDAGGAPVAAPGVKDPSQCGSAGAGDSANSSFMPGLLPFDLTRGGTLFQFRGRKNIAEYAAYVQDSISLGNFNFSPGLRLDRYAGLVQYTGWQPRIGGSYLVKRTGTVLRGSYSRSYESPYNENLILSSATGAGGLATNVFGAFAGVPLQPGKRNDFDAGLQQGIGRYLQIDGDYFWKYTDNAFDFDTLFNTPIAFPITWRQSKIDGFGLRFSTRAIHGFSVNTTMGHTRARFFGPENGGVIFNSPLAAGAFRIDHDQAFQQTTNLRFQWAKNVWSLLTWRLDSGLVAGSVPTLAAALALDGDQQAAIGFFCGGQAATLAAPITTCGLPFPQWGATRVTIPAPGTANVDTNPPRIASRNLLDLSVGDDNLVHTELGRMTARFTVTNLTNQEALYNFLSTFSGTHFGAPRAYQVQLGLQF